ncbi:MAG: hypothetical protein EAZ97_02630, partial [Bacteroidetes bacterium]
MKKNILLLLCLIAFQTVFAQDKSLSISKVEPTNWWVGMKNPNLQLLIYGKNISNANVKITYEGVLLKQISKVENPNYLFIDLTISSEAQAGKMPIELTLGDQKTTIQYELRQKSTDKNRIMGFNSSDLMYLLMPDRFANGDPSNDNAPELTQKADRKDPQGRHGGDIQGIIKNLDYLKSLGVTALWINPVLENNMGLYSYHGYSATDLYQVDKRFGGNEAYLKLIEEAHKKGIKIIKDMVLNHFGDKHWLIKDIPSKDWVNYPEGLQDQSKWTQEQKMSIRTNFRSAVHSDPYASEEDKKKMMDGWFDSFMPDLNQRNPLLATYLTQNSIWWIEYSGIDGIRMDTYIYPDKIFIANWAKALMTEYPQFNIVGEAWCENVGLQSYWQMKNNYDGYNSQLPSVTDFPIWKAIVNAFKEDFGWETGLTRLYYAIGQDYLYSNPNGNLIFADNHDVTRMFTEAKENLSSYKQIIAFLMTTRGIPQVYYGTEILFTGDGSNHAEIRLDYPGGWE